MRVQNGAACLANVKKQCLAKQARTEARGRRTHVLGKALSGDMGSPPTAGRRILNFKLNLFFGLFSEKLSLAPRQSLLFGHLLHYVSMFIKISSLRTSLTSSCLTHRPGFLPDLHHPQLHLPMVSL